MKKMITLCTLLFGVLTLTPCITHASTLDTIPTQIMETGMEIVEADVTAPTVTGLKGLSVVNEDTDLSKNIPASTDICTFTNKNVTLKITDPSGVAAIVLNGVEQISTGKVTAITDGYQMKVTKQDSYLLGVADMNGNVAWYRFVIDKKKPVIKVYDEVYEYDEMWMMGTKESTIGLYISGLAKDLSKELWFGINPEIYATDQFQFTDSTHTYDGIKSITINGVEVDLSKPELLNRKDMTNVSDWFKYGRYQVKSLKYWSDLLDPSDERIASYISSPPLEIGFPVLLPCDCKHKVNIMGRNPDWGNDFVVDSDTFMHPKNGKYVIRVTDLAGNVAQKTVNIDMHAPVVTIEAKKGSLYERKINMAGSDIGETIYDENGKYVDYYSMDNYSAYFVCADANAPVTISWSDSETSVASVEAEIYSIVKEKEKTVKKTIDVNDVFSIRPSQDIWYVGFTITDKMGNKTFLSLNFKEDIEDCAELYKMDPLKNQTCIKWKKTKK